jgi:hypothetical protein
VGTRMGPLRPGLLAAAAASFLAMGSTAACGEEEQPDQYVHCVDDAGNVVDPDRCDDDYDGGGIFWLWMSPTHYPVGGHAPSGWHNSRIGPRDTAARTRAGLPGTGKVGGTTVKGGGFGSGSTGGKAGTGGS